MRQQNGRLKKFEDLPEADENRSNALWPLGGHPKPAINRHLKTGN
jgi:hypothetical protein